MKLKINQTSATRRELSEATCTRTGTDRQSPLHTNALRIEPLERVISSGSMPQSITLARQLGAHHVFDYERYEIPAK